MSLMDASKPLLLNDELVWPLQRGIEKCQLSLVFKAIFFLDLSDLQSTYCTGLSITLERETESSQIMRSRRLVIIQTAGAQSVLNYKV